MIDLNTEELRKYDNATLRAWDSLKRLNYDKTDLNKNDRADTKRGIFKIPDSVYPL